MAPKKKVRTGKKRWHQIFAPKLFNNQVIGETYVFEDEQLKNKYVSSNLMTLTGNPKKQNTNVHFKVNQVKEGKAYTKTIGLEIQPSSLKRLVHRGRSKIADSFLAKSKVGEIIRIKPIVLTRTRADAVVQQNLRKKVKEVLVDVVNKYNFDTIVNDIVSMRLQKHLKEQLNGVYPVRSVEIRYIKYAQEPDLTEGVIEKTTYLKEEKKVVKPVKSDTLASLKEELVSDSKTESDVKEEDPGDSEEE